MAGDAPGQCGVARAKKRLDLARAWAERIRKRERGDGGDEFADDLKALGLPPLERPADEWATGLPLAVLPGNRRVWELWLALETQWRLVAGMTGLTRTGLDYPAADTVRRALGIKRRDAGTESHDQAA